jgi:hypothetical protein
MRMLGLFPLSKNVAYIYFDFWMYSQIIYLMLI